MPIKLMKMNFILFRISNKYDDFKGFYIVYILLNLGAIFSGFFSAQILYLSFFFGTFGIWFFSTEGVYHDPASTNNTSYGNSFVLENSLPMGRKNYLKSKILYFITLGFFSIILQIPSMITFFILKLQEDPGIDMDTFLHFKIGLLIILLIHLVTLFIYLSRIMIMQISKGKTSKNRNITKKIKWVIILIVVIAYPLSVFGRFRSIFGNEITSFELAIDIMSSLPYLLIMDLPILIITAFVTNLWILIPLFALAILLQLIWIFSNINKIDFHNQ